MKILMVTPYLPYPLFSGGQVRSFNIIKELSKKHDITLFAAIRNKKEQEHVPMLAKFCKKVLTFQRGRAFTPVHVVTSGITTLPFILAVYRLQELKRAIKEELEKEKYDVIHVETFYMMPNIPKTNVPTVLFEQNIEHDVYRRIANHFKPSYLRSVLLFDVFKMKKWEEYFWKKVQALVLMSEFEKSFVNGKAFICGNGVDTAFYRPIDRKKDLRILFLGNFKWFQNLDATRFILDEIWPKLKEKMPNAKLFIVGKHIPERIKKREISGVTFNENAPDDTREIYKEADVLLAPIRARGGTSFKVLEAMATGLPVVTTPFVASSISAKDGQELIVADEDNPAMFATKTIGLLQDEKLYAKIAKNARKLVEEKYDWKILVSQIEEIYTSVL